MKLKNKIILKGLFHSLLQLLALLLFGWFRDRIFEVCIYYVCFFTFRPTFPKQYHALTSWKCTITTIIVDFIVSTIIPNKSLSLLITIILTYAINYISFLYREYLDNKDLQAIKQQNVKPKKNSKRKQIIDILGKDNLDEESIEKYCISKGLINISETIYLFLNNTLEETSAILEIDLSTINRRINKFIKTKD